ncbi:hypothetical protein ABC345_20895 [Shouchella sp. 1P09AA]|uniref:hypothetical protein n=1 Tax=unclassified Shouchella TaxID=2893065 RepID=UPI0039A06E47
MKPKRQLNTKRIHQLFSNELHSKDESKLDTQSLDFFDQLKQSDTAHNTLNAKDQDELFKLIAIYLEMEPSNRKKLTAIASILHHQ